MKTYIGFQNMTTYIANSEHEDLHTYFRSIKTTKVIQDMKTYIVNSEDDDLHT